MLLISFLLLLLPLVPAQATERIIAGGKANQGSFPAMSALVSRNSVLSYVGQFCGGVLIQPRWVLTAAHCVNKKTHQTTDVVLDRLNLSRRGGQRIAVSAVRKHPLYRKKDMTHDFALLYLSKRARGVDLPRIAKREGSGKLWVSGWGLTEYGSAPTELLQTAVRSFSRNYCQKVYGNIIDGSMICAGGGGRDSCYGDSGGPLFEKRGKARILRGLVSWGKGCAQPGFPGVYSSIPAALPWIKRVTSQKPKVKQQKAGREVFPDDSISDFGPLYSIELWGPYGDETYEETSYYWELSFWERRDLPIRKIVVSLADTGYLCAPEMSDGCDQKRWVLRRDSQWYFSFYSERKCFSYKARIFPKGLKPFLYQDKSCSSAIL